MNVVITRYFFIVAALANINASRNTNLASLAIVYIFEIKISTVYEGLYMNT